MTLAVVLRDASPASWVRGCGATNPLRMERTGQVRRQARAAGRIYRSTELTPRAQAEQLRAILDSVAINTYDAERIAEDAALAA
ncbi:hypothetical protein ATO49_18135 [Mycolicibacterium fortuitum subsp. fortuitum DSM 46621 = ATCC 6841 = JCM 6387]|nr:hypothetical protein ATO49_18135 [Mycolicibacterium fortuitum subsp. fortuitum DSM 46621 = ATCC 6841 = JCM 6387]